MVGTGGLIAPIAGAALASAVAYRAKTDRHVSHTQWQFKEKHRPINNYKVYSTHNCDGSLNEEHCKFIDDQLTNESKVFNGGSKILSSSYSSEIRTDSLMTKGNERFIQAFELASSAQEKLAVLMTELDTAKLGYEERLLKVLDNKEYRELLSEKNNGGYSLLSHAIKKERYALAEKLIPCSSEIINSPNKEGKTPFLICLDKINAYTRSLGDSAAVERTLASALLASGVDLALSNQATLAKQVLTLRLNFGTPGTAFRQFFMNLNAQLDAIINAPVPNLLISKAANSINAPELPGSQNFVSIYMMQ